MILLNGCDSDLQTGAPLLVALDRLGVSEDARGIAISVDGVVVPRAAWPSFQLPPDARVEVLSPMQGG